LIKKLNLFGYSRILVGLIFFACGLYLGLTVSDPYNLVSLSGLFAYVLVIILVSEKSSRVIRIK